MTADLLLCTGSGRPAEALVADSVGLSSRMLWTGYQTPAASDFAAGDALNLLALIFSSGLRAAERASTGTPSATL
jgi:hypothetical protein